MTNKELYDTLVKIMVNISSNNIVEAQVKLIKLTDYFRGKQ